MHPVSRYYRSLEAVQSLRGIFQLDTVFRFAALPLAEIEPALDPTALWETAREIEKSGGIVRPLALVAAAAFYRRGDPGSGVSAQVRHLVAVRDILDAWGQAGGVTAFALTLGIGAGNPVSVLERAVSIHAIWKREHSWLTGEDDWPLAAWLATQSAAPEAVADATEQAYRALAALQFAQSNSTRLAAQILAMAPVAEGLKRFQLLVGALRDRNQTWAIMDAPAIAMLSLLPDPAADLARDVKLRTEAHLQGANPPSKMTAPSLSALMVFRERSGDSDLGDFLTLRIAALVAGWRELSA